MLRQNVFDGLISKGTSFVGVSSKKISDVGIIVVWRKKMVTLKIKRIWLAAARSVFRVYGNIMSCISRSPQHPASFGYQLRSPWTKLRPCIPSISLFRNSWVYATFKLHSYQEDYIKTGYVELILSSSRKLL